MTTKEVTLTARFEYTDTVVLEEYSDQELIEMAKETFYQSGMDLHGEIETIDHEQE